MMKIALLIFLAASMGVAQSPQPLPLKVSMISLGVKDTARSIAFYAQTLGMQMIGQPGEVTLFQAGSVQIALNHPLGDASGSVMVGAVEVIFSVEGVAAAHRQLAERGCTFIRDPHEVFAGTWAATLTDPDGHRLTILGPR